MGFSAATINGSVSSVVEGFDIPPYCQSSGIIQFDRVAYADNDIALVTVDDKDLAGQASVTVSLSSSSGDAETLTLPANSEIPGIFTGTIAISQAAPMPGDNRLQAAIGDEISAVYNDAANASGMMNAAKASARSIRSTMVFQDNIEHGVNGFVALGWKQTTAFSHSPTHSWGDSKKGANSKMLTLTSSWIKTTELIGARLIFWQRYKLNAGFDYGYIDIKIPQQKWQTIKSYTGQTDFQLTDIDLSRFDGAGKIKIRFRLPTAADISLNDWNIDDIELMAGALK
jgi:hypothetical protein